MKRIAGFRYGESPVERFALSAPARGVSCGDHVRVNFRNEDGRKPAFRIEELSSRQSLTRRLSLERQTPDERQQNAIPQIGVPGFSESPTTAAAESSA
jgi:hypothetical protein